MKISRKQFIKTAALTGIAGSIALPQDVLAAANPESYLSRGKSKGNTFLFQGDSITDAGRDRKRQGSANNAAMLGRGYAFLAACSLLEEHPKDNLKIYNRGISGNKVHQLAASSCVQ